MDGLEFRLKTLTPIWTGGVEGKTDKLHITGIKGSIRWWYEVLIRGLGYFSCDPISDESCKLDHKNLNHILPLMPQVKTMICPTCYLFGCTGWSSKFILKITDPDTNKPMVSLSSRGILFNLHFIEKKVFEEAEKALLKMTLKLIVDYGTIGGKTVFKPSEINAKNTKLHHRDFGIITRTDKSSLPVGKIQTNEINEYLKKFLKKSNKNNPEWPDFNNFWFIKGKHINRLQHNKIVNRNNTGKYNNPSETNIFLGGFISREKATFSQKVKDSCKNINAASKKIFSFHGTGDNDPIERCFGYTRSNEYDAFLSQQNLSNLGLQQMDVIKGNDLIKVL
jgi:CRISPR-associated protein Cmr1